MDVSMQQANSYLPLPAKVVRVEQMTSREMFFQLSLPEPLHQVPGQFVMVSVAGSGEAPISISSGPDSGVNLELVVRRVGNLTTALHQLKVGDWVGIRGPFGRGFDLNELYGRDLLFVVGGLGLVPLRSLILPVLAKREAFGRIVIISGARNPAEVLFLEAQKAWACLPGVEVIRLVDQPGRHPWDGEIGLVTEPISSLYLNPENTLAALCGPPVMYKFVLMALEEVGLPQDHIFLDLERRMKCGLGKCGHCQINHVYCCQDGPVFRFSELAALPEALR